MSDTKISALPQAPLLAPTDALPLVQGVSLSATRRASVAQLTDYAAGAILPQVPALAPVQSVVGQTGSVSQGALRTALGLAAAAYLGVGAVAGTVAAGDDARIVGALQPAGNLAGLTDRAVARDNLGLATVAASGQGTDLSWRPSVAVAARPMLDRLADRGRNVRDYGADPTAATDAKALAQAAVDALPAGATGLVVWPAGTYQISSSLSNSGRTVVHRFEPGAAISGGYLGKLPWPARVEGYAGQQRYTYVAGTPPGGGGTLGELQEIRNIGGEGSMAYGRRLNYTGAGWQGNSGQVFDIADGRIGTWFRAAGQDGGQFCTDWVVAVTPAVAGPTTRWGGFAVEFNTSNLGGAYTEAYLSRNAAGTAHNHWTGIIQVVPESKDFYGLNRPVYDPLSSIMFSRSSGLKSTDSRPARSWSVLLGEANSVHPGGYAVQWSGNDGTFGGAEENATFIRLRQQWTAFLVAPGATFAATAIDLSGATLLGDAIATPGARLTNTGHLVWTPSTTALLGANGQAALSAPSNTQLALSLQGSDGATRVATLPLEGLIASQSYVQGLTQYVVASTQPANAWADLRVPLDGTTYRDRAFTVQNNSVDGSGGRGSAAIRYLEQAAEGGAERAVIGYSSATGGYRTNSVFIEQHASAERYPAFRHYIYHAAGMSILPGAIWTPLEITGDYGTINLRRNDSALALSMDGTTGLLEVSRGLRSVSPATSTAGWLEARALRGADTNGSLQRSGALYLTSYRADSKMLLGASPLYSNAGIVAFGGNHTDGATGNIAYGASIAGVQRGDFNGPTDMPMGLLFRVGNTGVAAGTVNVVPGSVDAMLIDSDGKVGIGTNTPRARMHVNGGLILVPGSTPIALTNNGEVTVTMTSNTTLVFSARGTDGFTKTATLTLS